MENSPLELYEKAYKCHYEEKNIPEAVRYYESIVDKFPDSNECGYSVIQLQKINANNVVKAPQQEKKGLSRAAINLSILCVLLSVVASSLFYINFSSLAQERERTTLLSRALAKIIDKEYDDAIEYLTKLKTISGTDITPFELTAQVYRNQGKIDKAQQEFEIYRSLLHTEHQVGINRISKLFKKQ